MPVPHSRRCKGKLMTFPSVFGSSPYKGFGFSGSKIVFRAYVVLLSRCRLHYIVWKFERSYRFIPLVIEKLLIEAPLQQIPWCFTETGLKTNRLP